MRTTIAAATVAASLAVGGAAGALLGTPGLASAADTATEAAARPVGWVADALSGLVQDGTITQAQSDAVATALADARPEGGPGRRWFGFRGGLGTAAEALGMTDDELRAALADDQTIADVAAARGVELQTVIDALVAEIDEDLAEHVADGDLTQEQADARSAEARERVTAFVNGDLPVGGPERHRAWRGGPDETTEDTSDDTA